MVGQVVEIIHCLKKFVLKKVYITFAISVAIVLAAVVILRAGGGNGGLQVTIAEGDYSNLRVDSTIVTDGELEATLKPYRDSIASVMSRKLCECDEDMVSARPESGLSRLLSDILLEELRLLTAEGGVPEPDFALLNMGGMRAALPKGDIRVSNVFQVAPFENSPLAMNLDSATVCSLMAHIAERGGEAISGASFTVNEDGQLVDIKVRGKALKGDKTYRLATIDYLATGGDQFECLVGKEVYYHSGIPLRDMFIGHFARMGQKGIHAKAPTDVRVKLLNTLKDDNE